MIHIETTDKEFDNILENLIFCQFKVCNKCRYQRSLPTYCTSELIKDTVKLMKRIAKENAKED